MSFLDHIKNCNSYEARRFMPFYVGDEIMGLSKRQFVQNLNDFPDVFLLSEDRLDLHPSLKTVDERSQAITPVLEKLHTQGIIDTWVDEKYAVTHIYGEQPRLLMERAAVSYFGVRGYGVHINGLVQKADGIYVWIARRTKDKPFWPGMLDQMVAGGQPAGIGLMENVIKESAEEAGIPEEIANKAGYIGEIHYRGENTRGMNVDTLFNYDMWLPEDFIPENTDGEVDKFMLMPLEEMAHITNTSEEFKDNCNLVNIDLLLRQGIITKSHPDYSEIEKWLYAPAKLI